MNEVYRMAAEAMQCHVDDLPQSLKDHLDRATSLCGKMVGGRIRSRQIVTCLIMQWEANTRMGTIQNHVMDLELINERKVGERMV